MDLTIQSSLSPVTSNRTHTFLVMVFAHVVYEYISELINIKSVIESSSKLMYTESETSLSGYLGTRVACCLLSMATSSTIMVFPVVI